jgi:lipopolysaccharide/colanic/teichoic acid biosynthesis glycosyltransferase
MSSQPYGSMSIREPAVKSEKALEAPRDGVSRPVNYHRPGPVSTRELEGDSPVAPTRGWYLPVKTVIDFVLSVVLLIVLTPVVLVAAVAVKVTSRGPVIYRQTRMGLHGRLFTLYKLRTMVQNAEVHTGPVWSTGNDARVTRVGHFLRSSHIDEFPQLINVLLGQMSLVGPRPERPEFVAKLEWEIPYYRERLNVRPGITGLAQLRLPPDSDLEGVRRKVVHDLYYVRFVNPWLDARLLLLTGWDLFCHSCRFLWRLVALPSPQTIEHGFQRAVSDSCPPPDVPPQFASAETTPLHLKNDGTN